MPEEQQMMPFQSNVVRVERLQKKRSTPIVRSDQSSYAMIHVRLKGPFAIDRTSVQDTNCSSIEELWEQKNVSSRGSWCS